MKPSFQSVEEKCKKKHREKREERKGFELVKSKSVKHGIYSLNTKRSQGLTKCFF